MTDIVSFSNYTSNEYIYRSYQYIPSYEYDWDIGLLLSWKVHTINHFGGVRYTGSQHSLPSGKTIVDGQLRGWYDLSIDTLLAVCCLFTPIRNDIAENLEPREICWLLCHWLPRYRHHGTAQLDSEPPTRVLIKNQSFVGCFVNIRDRHLDITHT